MANLNTQSSIDLHRAGIIITRPKGQSATLIKRTQQHNGVPFNIPGLLITETENAQRILTVFARINEYDYLLFTSPNAVEFAAQYKLNFDGNFALIAIGSGTERSLLNYTNKPIIKAPKPYTSEALIGKLKTKNLAEKKILLVSGEGGRRILGDALQNDSGAKTEYIDVYKRQKPLSFDLNSVIKHGKQGHPLILFISSQEALSYLDEAFKKVGLNHSIHTVIVGSERLKHYTMELGYRNIIVATSALEQDLWGALINNIELIITKNL